MNKSEFDERQLIERGRAFRNAFFGIFGALLVGRMVDSVLETPVLDYFAMMLIPIWVSVSVFLTTVIMRDAIDKINQTSGWALLSVIWGAVGLFVTAASIIKLTLEPAIVDGALNEHIVQAFYGICMIEVCAVYWMKRSKDAKKAKADE